MASFVFTYLFDPFVVNVKEHKIDYLWIITLHSAIPIPVIEVHLSAINQREEFRKKSVIKNVCIGQISGKGKAGYFEALKTLVNHIENS